MTQKKSFFARLFALVAVFALLLVGCGKKSSPETVTTSSDSDSSAPVTQTYEVSAEEKAALKAQFDELAAVNDEVIAYVYAPGTKLDEPVVQTNDNSTYLDKTFEGNDEPYMGTVFMDMDNKADFSDKLTWLFGHARGSQVPDHRMFNDVNYYDGQEFFDAHPYVVVQTPERTYYYEAAFMIIVPETTAFYRTEFDSDEDFYEQLKAVEKDAHTKNPNITVSPSDRYLVLSTCREDDDTIRANLYLRQIPDSELTKFLEENGDKLTSQATR